MRRKEKLLHITKLNQKLNEDKFSWDGKYHNEDIEITNEHHGGEYNDKIMSMTISEFLDELKNKDEVSYEVVEKIIEGHFNEKTDESFIGFPGDFEIT